VPTYVLYVYSIGRTGRGERTGTAISFVDSDEDKYVMFSSLKTLYDAHRLK
jgi:superfamily II DNA/RNA helicase